MQVSENGEIFDVERRWRAMLTLDREAEIEVVTVPGVTTEEAIAEYTHDAAHSQRRKALREKLCFFRLSHEVLKRRHGLSEGRPEKDSRRANVFWDANKIREAAAKRAELGSYTTTRRLEKVLAEADEDLRESLESGALSIDGAYREMLRRRGNDGSAGSKGVRSRWESRSRLARSPLLMKRPRVGVASE